MAQVFFPDGKVVFVDASSPPHPKNTRYRLAVGRERWGETDEKVVKIQMEYDGKISGRRAPSYPFGTDDAFRVMTEVANLITAHRRSESDNEV